MSDFDFTGAESAAQETLGDGEQVNGQFEGMNEMQTEAETVQSEEVSWPENTETTEHEATPQTEEEQYVTFDPESEDYQKMLFKVQHGEEEMELPWSEVKDLAEKGFDYTQKRQRDAEMLQWAEQNREKVSSYEQFGEYIKNDPEVAQVLVAMDNPQFRDMLRQSGVLQGDMAQMQSSDPRLQQMHSELQRLRQEKQQIEQEKQQEQLAQQWRGRFEKLQSQHPGLFQGKLAKANEMKLRRTMQEIAAGESFDLVDYAFYKTFGNHIKQQAINDYLQKKTKGQGPTVQGRGARAPSAKTRMPDNVQDAFEMAEQSALQRFQEAERMAY